MEPKGIFLAPLLLLFTCSSLLADEQHHHPGGAEVGTERLGKVSFQSSCSPAVGKSFERAVALLHSFQYEAAEKGFRDVAQKDPHCGIAYWGVAMSLYHVIWEQPEAAVLQKGWEAVQKAESMGAKTSREREYIAAVSAFSREPDKPDYAARAAAYSKAMEQLYNHYPEDGEAAAFYALSLLAWEPPNDTTLVNRKKAVDLLQKLFTEHPDHPGAAHYLIHACDTPQLAPLALDAARRYAKIAPSSAHALHMPSHIFTRLGLWKESIDSNLLSAAAAERATAMGIEDAGYQLHAMGFLEYAYLQIGREADAGRLVEELKSVPAAKPDDLAFPLVQFPIRYAFETHDWKKAGAFESQAGEKPALQAMIVWARSIGEARSGDAAAARRSLEQLDTLRRTVLSDVVKYSSHPYELEREEAAAWVAYAEGRNDEAVKTLRAAANREDSGDGPDSLAMPAREMLGDLLMKLGQFAPALVEYEAALKESPNRFDGLYGEARAAALSGDIAKARRAYQDFLALWKDADPDLPLLEQARAEYAKLQ